MKNTPNDKKPKDKKTVKNKAKIVKDDPIAALNAQLRDMGIDEIKDVDSCPERTAYVRHLQKAEYGDKEWHATLKYLREQYKLAFHDYFASFHEHLIYEEGEDKVYFDYNPETGIYEELAFSTVRGWLLNILQKEDLRECATEGFAKNCLARFRGMNPQRGVSYGDFDDTPDWFHASNGWVNVKTQAFEPHTPDRLSRIVSAVAYDAKAKCPRYDKFLDEDIQVVADAVRVIDQFSGLLLIPDIRYQKMLTIIGKPGSGKSTLLDIWSSVLGEMATQKRLTDLQGDSYRFAGASLLGRTLCWFDEVDVKRSEMGNNLGTLVTGSKITVERKGVNGIVSGRNQLKCILTANSLPMSSEHGMYRRLILVHFARSFYDEMTTEVDINEQLEAEASGILNRMLKGLADLQKNRGFTVIAGHEDLIEEYKASSDTIAEFLDTYFEFNAKATPLETSKLFNAYKLFANDRHSSSITPQRFGRLLQSQPLNRFAGISNKKGTGGVRQWVGLQLKNGFDFNSDDEIVENGQAHLSYGYDDEPRRDPDDF